ncbi:MAG: FUSC family protein [Cetobacterium sp.]|uniref:FUSC family protein n=1 Tax=Cetobacterium sp. TaxID=2071632 RepID=UPI002FC5DF25
MRKEYDETLNKSLRISISVFLCVFLLKVMFGANPFYAAIAAVSCLQGTIKDSFKVGTERIIGTIFGGGIGLIAIYFISTEASDFKGSLIIGLSMMVIIFGSTYLLKKPASNTIACIVFLGIATNMEGRDPYYWALKRIVTTIIGVIIALICNWIISGEYKKSKFFKKKHLTGNEDM